MAQIQYVESEVLSFDPENPRLVEFGSSKMDEGTLINLLWREMAVEELVMSILSQGFFEHEPLYVLSAGGGKYIVLEGNRRLAAIRSILHPDMVRGSRMEKYLANISPQLVDDLTNRIPVIVMQRRQDVWRLLGFKHVNGPAKWGSFAKAKYISEVHNEYGVPLEQIAEQIGDTNSVVKKLYQGLMILEQAQQQAEFSLDDIKNKRIYFSHLYTALGYEKFRKYIGVSDDFEAPFPVPIDKVKNLQEMMDWIYGSKKRSVECRVRSQNPDLRLLIDILDNDMSVAALRAGSGLTVAVDLSVDGLDALKDAFLKAKIALEKASSKLGSYNGEEGLLKQAGTIANLADSIYDSMEKIHKSLKEGKKERISE